MDKYKTNSFCPKCVVNSASELGVSNNSFVLILFVMGFCSLGVRYTKVISCIPLFGCVFVTIRSTRWRWEADGKLSHISTLHTPTDCVEYSRECIQLHYEMSFVVRWNGAHSGWCDSVTRRMYPQCKPPLHEKHINCTVFCYHSHTFLPDRGINECW